MSDKQKNKKDSYMEKKSKAWNKGKQTPMSVTFNSRPSSN